MITLVEIEAIQIEGHRTVVELGLRHRMGIAGNIILCVRIVAVDSLLKVRICRSEDCLHTTVGSTCCINPTVLDIATTLVGDTGTSERARHTKVIDLAAEMGKQRFVETADRIAVAMERAIEALTILGDCLINIGCRRIICNIVVADRYPLGVLLRTDIAVKEEFQIATCTNVLIEHSMILRRTFCSYCSLQAQVEEVLQQVELALSSITFAVAVVDIYLRVASYSWVVYIEMVLLILHHGIEVVIVGHRQRHVVRIGLTQIGL